MAVVGQYDCDGHGETAEAVISGNAIDEGKEQVLDCAYRDWVVATADVNCEIFALAESIQGGRGRNEFELDPRRGDGLAIDHFPEAQLCTPSIITLSFKRAFVGLVAVVHIVLRRVLGRHGEFPGDSAMI